LVLSIYFISVKRELLRDLDFIKKPNRRVNAGSDNFNKAMNSLNKQATSALNDWNKTYSKYMDEYMPKLGN